MKRTTHVLRAVDDDTRRLGRSLVRATRFGALASIMPDGATPLCSRVLVASNEAGEPLLLVSELSAHTTALAAHPRCSILFGEPGTGDPLAAPRISVFGNVVTVEDAERAAVRNRFLARHPAAERYCDFPDFRFLRVAVSGANLNGGFARAYELGRDDLVNGSRPDLSERLNRAAAHMNADHRDTLEAIASKLTQTGSTGWRIVTIDPLGFEMASDHSLIRAEFAHPVERADDIRPAFVGLASPL